MTTPSQTKTLTVSDCEIYLADELEHIAWVIEHGVELSALANKLYEDQYEHKKHRLICGEMLIYVEEIQFRKGILQGSLEVATHLRHRAASIREGDYFEDENEEENEDEDENEEENKEEGEEE